MNAPSKIAIAAAQYPIGQPASLPEWQEKVAKWVADGAATGAELLVFPEYAAIEQAACFGPEVYGDLKATLHKVAEIAGERVAFHSELAAMHKVHILVGSGPVLKDDGRFVNAAQLVTPSGVIGEQEKLVMTPFERDWGISAGGPVRVFDTALGRIGIAICYDSEFPLLVRAMAEAGAELILVPPAPSGWRATIASGLARWRGHWRIKSPPCRARPSAMRLVTCRGPQQLARPASMCRPKRLCRRPAFLPREL